VEVPPGQIGPVADAVIVGNGFITTFVVPLPLHPLASVIVTEYVPAVVIIAGFIEGL
jgi:hypothetical protein